MDERGGLDVLVCEWTRRPRGEPTFADVAGALRDVRREGGTLVAEYDPSIRGTLTRVVAAEQLCCPTIGWDVLPGPGATLRITGGPGQLETLEAVLKDAG